MKYPSSTLFRRMTAFVLAVLLAVPAVYASAGEEKLQTATRIVDGLTYYNTVTVNGGRRIESYSLELEPDSDVEPILLQGSGTIYGAASINRAVSNAREQGYHVLGAINTDFFSTSTGMPLGIVIEDGVYKSSGPSENAMLITDGQVSIMGHPQVELSLTNETTGATVTPNYFNKVRNDIGGIYLLNHDFSTVSTRTSSAGWYVRMKAVPDRRTDEVPALTVNSTLTLEVTELLRSDQAIAIGEGEYILTAADLSYQEEAFLAFQVGDEVTLTTSCQDEDLSRAQWAGGVGDIMIRDGAITDSSTWTYRGDGRQPRTALGLREDGTLVLYAVDGRQSDHSAGLSQLDLADELLAQGCTWAVNLDGGGSTALSVWVPGQSGTALQNSPSDGKPRSCATYLLLVTEEEGDGRPDRLAWTEGGLTVLTGARVVLPQAVALDDGLNLVSADLDDLRLTSREDLGTLTEDGFYLAGDRPGTDTIRLSSRREDVEGEGQIHVVDALTEFTVSKAGSTSPLTALQVEPGEQVQLAVSGSYWGRAALRDFPGVTWTVEGDVGTLDETGLFTASDQRTSGSVTFSAGGLSQTVQITMANVHEDVVEGDWAYEAVEYCYEHGIVSGVSTTLFGRDNQIRRGDFMLMLYNALGKPTPAGACTFTDVSPSDYYYTALSWGQGAGLASGTGGGAYSPTASVTREQAFTILRQAMPLLGKDCPDGDLSILDQFGDRDQIADYALSHAATLVEQGLVAGKGDGLDPKGNLTRAEMAAILYQIITYTPKTEEPADPTEPTDPVLPDDPVDPGTSVAPALYTLALDQSQLSLDSGARATLTATLSPAAEGAALTWSSSDPTLATVSATGVVTNLSPRREETQVTITASWNGLTASCTVTCAPARSVGVVTDAELGLNVRVGPGTSYPAAGSLANADQVLVLGEEDGWYQILFRNGAGQAAVGYVSGDYLTLLPENS